MTRFSRLLGRILPVTASVVVAGLVLSACSVVENLTGPVTFYVSADGDDEQTGTSPTTAWATLERASSEDLAPGDTVVLTGDQPLSGSLRLDSRDAGDPATPVIITAAAEFPGITASGSAGIEIMDTSGVRVEAVTVTVPDPEDGGSPTTDGILLYASAGSGTHENVTVENTDIQGGSNGVAIFSTTADAGFSSVTMRDLRITGSHRNGILSDGPPAPDFAHSDIRIIDSTVSGVRGVPGLSTNSGNGIALGSVDGALVEGTEASRNGEHSDAHEGPIGIWAYESTAVIFRGNVSHHNSTTEADGGGFGFDVGVTDSLMERNLSHDNAGPGILVFTHGSGGANSSNTIRYNATVGDATRNNFHGAISIFGSFGTGDDETVNEDLHLHHNTAIPSPLNGAPALRLTGNLPGFVAHHNILGDATTLQPVIRAENLNTAFIPVLSANLLPADTGTGPQIQWNGRDLYHLEELAPLAERAGTNIQREIRFRDLGALPEGLSPVETVIIEEDVPADQDGDHTDLLNRPAPSINFQVGAVFQAE